MLVAYAGKDPEEPPLDTPETKYLHRKTHTRPEMAYRMFRMGRDTLDLAARFSREEQTIVRWITAERCKRLGLPNPYQAQHSNRILVVNGVRGEKQ